MTQSIARNPLIQVSAALYAKDPELVEQSMNAMPEPAQHKIYQRMWEVMGRPEGDRYGEIAFQDVNTPAQKKIDAVEKVILNDAEPVPVPVKPTQPKDSVVVKNQRFFDAGFDPRFSVDGNFMMIPQRSMRQVVSAIVAYCIFFIKSYCSFSREEREFRQAVLTGASLEKVWSSYCECALITDIDDPCLQWIPLAEYDFLETIGNLYQRLNPSSSSAPRLFPREMMNPIHRMNRPQDDRQTIDKMQPGLENRDLARMGTAFARLSKNGYTIVTKDKNEHSFDTFEYNYVPHYLFTHATSQSAESLKIACRLLRQQVAETTTDFKCAFSFAACQTKLKPAFAKFHQAWQEYVQSHELLAEAQMVFSQENYFTEAYEAFRKETKMSAREIKTQIEDKANRVSELARDRNSTVLHIAYRTRYQETKTGRFLHARHEALSLDSKDIN